MSSSNHKLSNDVQGQFTVDGKEVWLPLIPYPFFTTKGLPFWKRLSEKYWRPECSCGRIFETIEDYNAHIVFKNSPYSVEKENV